MQTLTDRQCGFIVAALRDLEQFGPRGNWSRSVLDYAEIAHGRSVFNEDELCEIDDLCDILNGTEVLWAESIEPILIVLRRRNVDTERLDDLTDLMSSENALNTNSEGMEAQVRLFVDNGWVADDIIHYAFPDPETARKAISEYEKLTTIEEE